MSNPSVPVAVITGAASGIGAACAALLRRQGWRTAGLDLRPSDTDVPVIGDITERALVKGAVDVTAERFGRIDLLVSAAGFYEEGVDVAEITIEQWDRMLAVVLGGTVNAASCGTRSGSPRRRSVSYAGFVVVGCCTSGRVSVRGASRSERTCSAI